MGYLMKFYRGRLRAEVHIITLFHRKDDPFIYLPCKMIPLSLFVPGVINFGHNTGARKRQSGLLNHLGWWYLTWHDLSGLYLWNFKCSQVIVVSARESFL